MSTHKNIDVICIAIIVFGVIATLLFMNGEALGLHKLVDEDRDKYDDILHFSSNDLNADWDTENATVITLSGDSADISGDGAYILKGDVVISKAGYYVVTGELSDGSLVIDSSRSSKIWVLLDGVDIYAEDDAAIRVDQADKVFFTLAKGSENHLASGAMYSEQAVKDGVSGTIFSHDDITINGSGMLDITADYMHGIKSKDDLVVTGGTISIQAVRDGINVNDSVRLTGADIRIECTDDGIDQDDEGGYFYMESGTLLVTALDDAVTAMGDILFAGGSLTATVGNDCLHSDAGVYVSGGEITSEECHEGFDAYQITVSGGDIYLCPADDGMNASYPVEEEAEAENTSLQNALTGKSQLQGGATSDKDQPQGGDAADVGQPQGGTAAEAGQSQGGTATDVGQPQGGTTTDADQSQGGTATDAVQSQKGVVTNTNPSQQDAITENRPFIRIEGGSIEVVNRMGSSVEGFDSDGSIYISGGSVRISLANYGSNRALRIGEDADCVCQITGGDIIACGNYAKADKFDSSSTQGVLTHSSVESFADWTTVTILDADGKELLSWEVPCSFSWLTASCPDMVPGGEYHVAFTPPDSEETE